MDDVMAAIRAKVELQFLLRDLARLTGVSEEDALREALRDTLARLKGPTSREERIERARATLRLGSRSTEGRRPASQDEWDRALGYGKEGV